MAHHDFKLMQAQKQEQQQAKTEQFLKNVISKGGDIYKQTVQLKQADDIAQGSKAFDLWEQYVGGQYDYDYKNNPNFGDDGYKERLLGTSPDTITEIANMNLSEGARQVLDSKINNAKNSISIQYDHDQMVWRNGRISSTIQSAVDISLSDRNNTSMSAINQTLGATWQTMNPNNVNLMGANGGRLEQQIYEAGAVATLRNEFIRLKTATVGANGETLATLSDTEYMSKAKENIQAQLNAMRTNKEGWQVGIQKEYIDTLTDIDYKTIITQGNKDIATRQKEVLASKEQIIQGVEQGITDTIQRANNNNDEIESIWENVGGKRQLTNALGLKDSIERSKASYVALGGNDENKRKEYANEFDTIVGDKLIETQLNKLFGDVNKGVYTETIASEEIKGNGKTRLQEQIDLLPDTIQKEVLQKSFDVINRHGGDYSNLANFYVESMKTLGDGSDILFGAYERISAGWSKDQLTKWLYDNIEGKGGILSQSTKESLYNLTKLADISGVEKERFTTFMQDVKDFYKNGNSKEFYVDTNGDGKEDDLAPRLKNAISNLYWTTVLNDDKGEYWGEKGREKLNREAMKIIQNTTVDGLTSIYNGIDEVVKVGTMNGAKGYKLVADIRSNPLISSTANDIAKSLRANNVEIYKTAEDEDYYLNQASKVYYDVDKFNDLNEWEQLMIKSGTAIYRVEALEGRDIEQVKKLANYNWGDSEVQYDKQGKIRFVVSEDKDGVVSMLTPIGAINPNNIVEKNDYEGIQDGYIMTFGRRDRYGNIDWNTTSDEGWVKDGGKVFLPFTRQQKVVNEGKIERLDREIEDADKRGDYTIKERLIEERQKASGSSDRQEPIVDYKTSRDISISNEDKERLWGKWGEISTRRGLYKTARGIV